ncbi:hypothetical protein ET132_27030, partial [Klebsiella pneumoniae]
QMCIRDSGKTISTTMEQVNAGMRVARRQNRPFLPSPGQFVAWCREEASVTAGLPNVSELVDMVYELSLI